MRQYWHRQLARIDGLSLRERGIVFAMAALALVFIVHLLLLEPLFDQNRALSGQIKDVQTKLVDARRKIEVGVRLQTTDPDLETKRRLKELEQQSQQMRVTLQDMQKGLVSPDKMPRLLESMLLAHGNLRLVSLKTLPPSNLTTGDATTAADKAVGHIYRHGVEITVQGSYFDMVGYMAQLESMPWQVFWGRAVLDANEYLKSTLTLTLHTLSLDKQWLNI